VPVSPVMRRLLRIRELQEDESRSRLENALQELRRLESSLAVASEQEKRGRRLIADSARSSDLLERLAGLEQERSAIHAKAFLVEKIATSELHAAARRAEYLATRIELRQVRTLIEKLLLADRRDEARRNQNNLDEWFRSRR